MVTLKITLDAQTFDADDFAALLQDGLLLSIIGLINRRWDEFSAADIAIELGLKTVKWEQTWDDTPGTLTCLIGYWSQTKAQIQRRLLHLNCIIDQELYGLI